MHKISKFLDLTDQASRFEREYREAVARNLDVLQLIGADVSLPNRRHQLSVAYISLSALQNSPHLQTDLPTSGARPREQNRKIVPVETILASAQRLLIVGPAGPGKTTLLQWIAVRAATRTFIEPLREWNDFLPFYIRLRQYVTADLPQPEKFPAFAAPAIFGEMPLEWVHNILRSGRAIILVDGLDEMSASRREEVQTWLRDLIETYNNCHFIVTSRPHAMESGWMNHNPFETTSLQEMTLSDIYSFIDHWHDAIRQELLTEEEKSELMPLADHLKGHIKQTRTLRNLATNPLLCAMLCALNRERRRHLPVNRIELYQACSSLLLERREKDRHIDLSDYPVLTYSQKERLLTGLAHWMTKKNLAEAEVSKVDRRFTSLLMNMPNIPPDTTGKAARRLLVERSGMMREPIIGQIDFAHRTFQEFFTAQASVNSIRYLIAHAHLDQWREVIILTAGLVRKTQCDQLMKGLLQRGSEESEHRYRLYLLTVSCLETAIELGEEMRNEIEIRFGQLIPPKNMTEAKALSSAGDLVLKHLDVKRLSTNGKLLVSTSAACVRTLALIGGEIALDLLEEYASDTRRMVTDELLNAWDRFDRESYAKRVLAKAFRNKESLILVRLSSLDGIQYLPNLTTLDLSDTQVSDLSLLTSLPNLTELTLVNTQVSDLSLLTSLQKLEVINWENS